MPDDKDDTRPGDYRWLMNRYGIGLSTARSWVAKGKVPCFHLAGSAKLVRFNKQAVISALEGTQ